MIISLYLRSIIVRSLIVVHLVAFLAETLDYDSAAAAAPLSKASFSGDGAAMDGIGGPDAGAEIEEEAIGGKLGVESSFLLFAPHTAECRSRDDFCRKP